MLIQLVGFKCDLCGYIWSPRNWREDTEGVVKYSGDRLPIACASCKRHGWNNGVPRDNNGLPIKNGNGKKKAKGKKKN